MMIMTTKQYNLVLVVGHQMSCSWEGNRRYGVVLAMDLSGLSTYDL